MGKINTSLKILHFAHFIFKIFHQKGIQLVGTNCGITESTKKEQHLTVTIVRNIEDYFENFLETFANFALLYAKTDV